MLTGYYPTISKEYSLLLNNCKFHINSLYMNFLSLFVLIPALMMMGLFLSNNRKQLLAVMTTGAILLMTLSGVLAYMYFVGRAAGDTATMLFTADTVW